MRRITAVLVTTIAVVVLMFSYHTSTMGARPVTNRTLVLATSRPAAVAATTFTPPTAEPAPTAEEAATMAAPQVIDGALIDTRWGPVQVQVTIDGGAIIDVRPLTVPYDRRKSREINDYAVPILDQAIIDAQSVQFDTVSGATYTSDGYRASLQSVLDRFSLGA